MTPSPPAPMATERRPKLALAVLAIGSATIATTVGLRLSGDDGLQVGDAFQFLVALSFVALGAITLWRRPDNRMSWLFAWVGLVLGLSLLTDEYGTLDFDGPRPALATVAAWFSSWLWVPAFGPLLTLLFLWFPDGRPPSPRWRPVERAAFVLIGVLPLFLAFAQDPESDGRNPLAIPWLTAVLEKVMVAISPLFPVLVGLCAASLVIRFRNSRGERRQQLKWFVLAGALLLIYISGDTIVAMMALDRPAWFIVFELIAFLSVPAGAGVAILKYCLYDIDVIINRTLVYGALTATLLLSYLLIVVGLGRILDPVTRDSDIAVAASTLVVAALFRPLRTRIQSFIDRRFYRSRYDASRALSDFGTRLRDEVDIDTVREDVLGVVSKTIQPAHMSLWMPEVGR